LDKSLKLEESEENFYYDIPIKDFKKKPQNNEIKEPEIKYSNNIEIENKKKIIDEILKESVNFSLISKDRPFTPPFNKLVPLNVLKSQDSLQINNKVEGNNGTDNNIINLKLTNRLLDSLDPNIVQIDKENIADFVYDHVLNCYYDTKNNIYYELK
jgi:hypothetical protein